MRDGDVVLPAGGGKDQFQPTLQRELQRGSPTSLVFIDLDGFKAVNDTHGHQAGDQCIAEMADAILPDGRLGQYKASTNDINAAIGRGQIKRDYSNIRVPVLAFIDYPWPPDDPRRSSTVIVDDREYQPANDNERAAIIAYARVERKRVDQRTANLKRSVANARVVDIPVAGHYLFLTREAEVLAGMHSFVMTLK